MDALNVFPAPAIHDRGYGFMANAELFSNVSVNGAIGDGCADLQHGVFL